MEEKPQEFKIVINVDDSDIIRAKKQCCRIVGAFESYRELIELVIV